MTIGRNDAWALGRLDAHAQAALVRNGTLPPEALVEAAILRIEELDPRLNSVSYRAFDHARAACRTLDRSTALAGVPTLLKASLAFAGFPLTSCSRAQRDLVATTTYPYAERLVAEGLVPIGMSTMPEYGLLCSGEPLLTGPTLNPWNAGRSAGGSSTGAAVAVAAGLVPIAHASDAGGSIRIPAGNCGVVGFKPSRGWNLRARSHHLIDDLLCSDSMIGRSMRDVAWAARVERPADLSWRTEERRPLTIALDMAGLDGDPDVAVAAQIHHGADLLRSLGHRVTALSVPYDRSALRDAFLTLMPYLGGAVVDHVSALHPGVALEDLLEPWTIGLWRKRQSIPAERLGHCYAAIGQAIRIADDFHREWDVVLSPVARTLPLELGRMAPTQPFEALWTTLFDYIDYTPVHNMLGLPSISVPLGMVDGLPVGTLLSAGHGCDERLLTLAGQLEEAAPWGDRWPAIVPGATRGGDHTRLD
ncbi:MAG: amidase [Sphingomonas taxi]|uniref:Amidase n=1 Tax=Sphingomonas taxi TaxID=1549858 RepID=A0A2W5P8G6_9SPHN|nr:MAG: amidase [Sphingomonas taxi]